MYVKHFIPDDKSITILDAGCGDGRHALELSRCGYTAVSAIDLFEELVDESINYKKASIEKLPFEDGQFEFIYSMGSVVNYASPPEKGINEIARVLKPGGKCLISSHTLHSTHTLSRLIRRKIGMKTATHLHGLTFYSTAQMIKAQEQAGLEMLEVTGYQPSVIWYGREVYMQGYNRVIQPILQKLLGKAKYAMPSTTKSKLLKKIYSVVGYHAVYYSKKI